MIWVTLPLRLALALLLLVLPLAGQELELRFLDVGQADAALIREKAARPRSLTPGGAAMSNPSCGRSASTRSTSSSRAITTRTTSAA